MTYGYNEWNAILQNKKGLKIIVSQNEKSGTM